MTDTTVPLKDRPLESTEELRALIQTLLDRANRRQMWLMFMDDRGCLGDPLMPMDDYPDDPTEITSTDDLGEVDQATLLMHRMSMLREMTGNVAIVLVWERLGSSVIGVEDREWAKAMRVAAAALDVPLHAQFVLHSRGVRQLQIDDIGRDGGGPSVLSQLMPLGSRSGGVDCDPNGCRARGKGCQRNGHRSPRATQKRRS